MKYRLECTVIQRRNGHSATAASAYRGCMEIIDMRTGETHDYTRKGGLAHHEIVVPPGERKPVSTSDLWNQAEAAERRKDACVAREYKLDLPKEFSPKQRMIAGRIMADIIADEFGVAIQLDLHLPHRDQHQDHHHAHLLSTTRIWSDGQLHGKARCEWDSKKRKAHGYGGRAEDLAWIRERWADVLNDCREMFNREDLAKASHLSKRKLRNEPEIAVLSAGAVAMERRLAKSRGIDIAGLSVDEVLEANAESGGTATDQGAARLDGLQERDQIRSLDVELMRLRDEYDQEITKRRRIAQHVRERNARDPRAGRSTGEKTGLRGLSERSDPARRISR